MPHSGLRALQITAPKSSTAQLISTAKGCRTVMRATRCRYGSYRISASRRGPKYRSMTRAMFTSSRGSCSPWANNRTALATYCPTAGIASNAERSLGQMPSRRVMSAANRFNAIALRRHRPRGRSRQWSSVRRARAMSCHVGKAVTKSGSSLATCSALVCWRRTSVKIRTYSWAWGSRQGNARPWSLYQSRIRLRNVAIRRDEGGQGRRSLRVEECRAAR